MILSTIFRLLDQFLKGFLMFLSTLDSLITSRNYLIISHLPAFVRAWAFASYMASH